MDIQIVQYYFMRGTPTASAAGANANVCAPFTNAQGANQGTYIKVNCNSADVATASLSTLMIVALAFMTKKIQF